MVRIYGGYMGAIKDGESFSEVSKMESDNPMNVVNKLEEECKKKYPLEEGWTNHAISKSDGIVIYGEK